MVSYWPSSNKSDSIFGIIILVVLPSQTSLKRPVLILICNSMLSQYNIIFLALVFDGILRYGPIWWCICCLDKREALRKSKIIHFYDGVLCEIYSRTRSPWIVFQMFSVLYGHMLTAVSGLFLCSMQLDFEQNNLAVYNRIMLESSFIEVIKEETHAKW